MDINDQQVFSLHSKEIEDDATDGVVYHALTNQYMEGGAPRLPMISRKRKKGRKRKSFFSITVRKVLATNQEKQEQLQR